MKNRINEDRQESRSQESRSASPLLRVVKFGGSSMATADAMKTAAAFLRRDKSRRFAVVSAPGKPVNGASHADERLKVTDLLLAAWEGDRGALHAVRTRFARLSEELGAGDLLEKDLALLPSLVGSATGKDYFISRGEYLSAKLFAFLTGYRFFDAAELLFFGEDGRLDEIATENALRNRLLGEENGVLPGFYGRMPGGTVRTFSRGGSDITGALVAAALDASLYENMTDVNGLLEADPRIVKDPLPVREITYEKMRALSLLGAAVLHEDAVLPVKKKGIEIDIRNTFDQDAPGTAVVRKISAAGRMGASAGLQESDPPEKTPPTLFCVSGKSGFTLLHAKLEGDAPVEKCLAGLANCIANCFAHCDIPLFHLQSGSGCVTALCKTEQLRQKRRRLLHHLTRAIKPSYITLQDGVALVTVVSEEETVCGGVHALLAAAKELSLPLRTLSVSGESPIAGIDESALADFLQRLYALRKQTGGSPRDKPRE